MAFLVVLSGESARPVERVTQLLIERVDPRLQTLFPPRRARGVFSSGLHEVGLDRRHVAFELVVGHVGQRTAEHHAAERVHARVDELSRLLVDLRNQRGVSGLELVLDVANEVAADPRPRDVGARSENEAGRRTNRQSRRAADSALTVMKLSSANSLRAREASYA
jgi:hypothetical protein